MTVSFRLFNSSTPAPPCARPHYPCTQTGISQLEAARRNRSTTPFILIFTPHCSTASHNSAYRRQRLSYQATREADGTLPGLFQERRNTIGRAGHAETFPPHFDQYARKQLPFQTTAA